MAGKDVSVRATDGGAFGAYLAEPDRTTAPGIVVLQEIFGVNAFVRGVCDGLAQAGYIAIAPDLFWRQAPGVELDSDDPGARDRAMKLMQGLDEPLALSDIAAAAAHLRTLPQGSGKVGAVGYCLGGKLAYLAAARTNVDAAVSYYGVGIQGALGEAGGIHAPLLLHIAADDPLCEPPAQQAIADALGAAPGVRIVTHPGVGHAFARLGSTAYRASAAAAADAETMTHFDRFLR